MTNRYSSNEAKAITKGSQFLDQALVDTSKTELNNPFHVVTLALDTARNEGNAYPIKSQFKSVFVAEATDSAVEVGLTVNSDQINAKTLPLKKNGSFIYNKPIGKGQLTWEAQSGKSITLVFILDGEFRPGSLFTEVAGSVDGNSISNPADVTVTTTAAALIAEDLNRKIVNIYASAPIYIASSASSTYWFPLPAGWSKLSNTAAIYAKTLTGTSTVNLLVES